jgi:hypothetical protein
MAAPVHTETAAGSYTVDKWTFDAVGNGPVAIHRGGPVTFGISVASTMGGGTVTWQWSPDAGTSYCNIGSIAWTAATDGAVSATLAPGLIRPVLTGGGGAYGVVVFMV